MELSTERDCDQNGQKKPDPGCQEAHVVTGGAEDCVDCVAFWPGEVVSFEMSVVLEVTDDGLDHCRQVNACIHREGRFVVAFRGGWWVR